MKYNLLLLLFLFLIAPTISTAAEMRTLEIDFSFNAPIDSGKQLLGYRLYKDGQKVCETNETNASKMDCALLTESGTFDFTLAAYYSNDSESPQSAPFSFTIEPPVVTPPTDQGPLTFGAEARNLAIDFSFDTSVDTGKQLLGYRLYKDGQKVCETSEPNISKMDCALLTEEGTFNFTLSAYYSNDTESPPSSSFPFTISSTHSISFNWAYTDGATNAGGFRIYDNGVLVYETPSSSARQFTYVSEFSSPTHVFTITAVGANGVETPIPNGLAYTENTTPTAVLSSSTAAGQAPLAVTFDGSASTTPNAPMVTYSWAFGDGSKGTGKTASHVFTAAGTYYAQLTVTDSDGLTDKKTTPIIVTAPVVTNQKPSAVISVDQPQSGVPLKVSCNGSQSSDPDGSITLYNWDFGDGTTGSGVAVQHMYSAPGTYTVSLQVTDNKGATATATRQIDRTSTQPHIEVGEVTINQEWVRVLFANTFNQPVVVVGPASSNDTDPVSVRVRNIDQGGFEIRLQEWDYLDGTHAPETLSYIVIEKGVYTLDNGSKLEAGSFTGSSSFNQVPMQQVYNFTPVVLTQVVTDNEIDAVIGRVRNTNQYSFEYMLQEMQLTVNAHIPETINYVAWEPGKGEVSGLLYETGITGKSVTHRWFNLAFETQFPDQPFFIAGMQTYEGADTATVRSQSLSTTAARIKIEEEKSKDREVRHNAEVVGYLTLGAATAATPQP